MLSWFVVNVVIRTYVHIAMYNVQHDILAIYTVDIMIYYYRM